MSDDERKPRLHIHLGGLVILIIIFLLLFKVDLRSKIDSPQFQKNLDYVTEEVKFIWQKYISDPLKDKINSVFIDFTNKEIQKIQDNFSDNVLKIPEQEKLINGDN